MDGERRVLKASKSSTALPHRRAGALQATQPRGGAPSPLLTEGSRPVKPASSSRSGASEGRPGEGGALDHDGVLPRPRVRCQEAKLADPSLARCEHRVPRVEGGRLRIVPAQGAEGDAFAPSV